MIVDKIFNGCDECFAQIETDFSLYLSGNLQSRRLLMRGENFPYDTTESSMKRFLAREDQKTMHPIDFVSPFVDFEELYAEYLNDRHGLSMEEGVGFLQHYGFPTDLFDLSASPETARFFASHERESDPEGMVGVFVAAELEQHFMLTDLSRHPFALRPRNQVAFAARPLTRIRDLKHPECDKLFTCRWYKFHKTKEDFEFARSRKALAYPSESELSYFFNRDFDAFFKEHWTSRRENREAEKMIQEKLAKVRDQLK